MLRILSLMMSLSLMISPKTYAEIYKTISFIEDISEVIHNADQETLVIFDVDNVITAPKDLIARPKARKLRQAIFKTYEEKYGKERVIQIHSQYYMRVKEELVEPIVKEVILKLQQRNIPTLALTGLGTEKFRIIENPMQLRISGLKQNGINFFFPGLNKRMCWDNEAGYQSGVIFSGKQSKGQALQHFLEKVVMWKPSHIVFIDDDPKHLKSVHEICTQLKINFSGFLYQAATFKDDRELSTEVARFQLRTLDEQRIWITDEEAKKMIEDKTK